MQEGSILFASYVGDPLTPGLPATKGMYRRSVNESDLPGIPAQVISYGDAMELLQRLGGNYKIVLLTVSFSTDISAA